MAVAVMIVFARSGGTVLNQCLGSLPDVVIMSEVNPLGGGWGEKGSDSLTSVTEQAKHWYQIELKSKEFVDSVLELERICNDNNKQLILRDWTFSNFMPHPVNDFDPPNKLLTLEALSGKCELLPFVFIRDAIDVWISRGLPPTEDFFKNYRRYVKEITKYPVYKYEDFCRHPAETIQRICDYTKITYDESWRYYQQFRNVHGDVQSAQKSRGVRNRKIQPLSRKRIPADRIKEVDESQDMIEVNKFFDYPTRYSTAPLENYFEWILSKVVMKTKNIINR